MSIAIIIDETEEHDMSPLEERATILGYAGLIPFILCALALWLSPALVSYNYAGAFMKWTLFYAAIVLSFMGGIRWGLALLNDVRISEYVTLNQLTWSVVPALIAWLVVMPENTIAGIAPNYLVRHLIILISFIALMSADIQATRDGFAPPWYGPMRLKLTFFLGMTMLLIMLKLFLLNW